MENCLLTQVLFALNITGPILILLLVGIFLRRINFIDEHFIRIGNALVFRVTLPLLLFFSMASNSDVANLYTGHVVFGAIVTMLFVVVLLFIAPMLVSEDKIGIFVQGAFRGNVGVIGTAFVLNAYGESALSTAAVYIGGVTIIYNVVSVWLLGQKGDAHIRRIASNPLILAICAGFVYSLFSLPIPHVIAKSGEYLGNLTLPLALLCIGGTLRWSSFKLNHKEVIIVVLLKVLLTPMIAVVVAIVLGFRGVELGILYFMFSSPTAAASYVMAKQMTKHGELAAEIIALSTVLSPLSLTLGLVILKSWGFL